MFYPMVSIVSGTKACLPARPARSISQISAHCSGHRIQNRPPRLHQLPRASRSPCANHATAAAARCASSRSFGAVRNPCLAHHRGSMPHDATPVHRLRKPPAVPAVPVTKPCAQCLRLLPERSWATFTAAKSTRQAQDQTGIQGLRPLCLAAGCTRGLDRTRTFPKA
jgi:hypothetical protein